MSNSTFTILARGFSQWIPFVSLKSHTYNSTWIYVTWELLTADCFLYTAWHSWYIVWPLVQSRCYFRPISVADFVCFIETLENFQSHRNLEMFHWCKPIWSLFAFQMSDHLLLSARRQSLLRQSYFIIPWASPDVLK